MSRFGVGAVEVPDGCTVLAGRPAGDLDVAIVASRFNAEIVQRLLDGAVGELETQGVGRERVTVVLVPGAFELPLACRRLAMGGGHHAVIALGCVIRGETPHFDYVCAEAARGISEAAAVSGIPVTFGVITANTLDQAQARSGGSHGNAGASAAAAAVEMAGLLRTLPRSR
ncbi:MAG TPA: 6,7-dimethyl-8-ribityllumazine synthase [Gaiellales bacterium]|nr:6,7-dimethyl-8-ribityllumazine synthase [Gaiellales bacterium]